MIALTPEGAATAVVAALVILAAALLREIRRQRRVHREILTRREQGAEVRRMVADTIKDCHVAAVTRRLREHG
jgi:hypothetical protein